MKLEAVGRVSMRDVRLEIGWQIDDIDSSKGTFLWADTTTDAKTLRDEGDLGRRIHFDTETATSNDGAGFFAFLSAFLRKKYFSLLFHS